MYIIVRRDIASFLAVELCACYNQASVELLDCQSNLACSSQIVVWIQHVKNITDKQTNKKEHYMVQSSTSAAKMYQKQRQCTLNWVKVNQICHGILRNVLVSADCSLPYKKEHLFFFWSAWLQKLSPKSQRTNVILIMDLNKNQKPEIKYQKYF